MRVLLPVAIIFCSSLSAQTTFAPVGAKWTYTQGQAFGPDSNLMTIEVLNEAVIGDQTWSELTIDQGWLGCHAIPHYFAASNDSLYYLDPIANERHLWFRWNAVIGDTWSTPIAQSGYLDTLDWIVSDTGRIEVDGTSLRRLYATAVPRSGFLYSESCGEVIERLGSPSAPFSWIFFACDGEVFQGLRCYEDPDISWLNPQFAQCDLATGIPDPFVSSELMISPTVIDRGGTVSITSTETVSIELLDATGRIAQHARTNATISIDQPGLYFVRASIGSRPISTQRILVR